MMDRPTLLPTTASERRPAPIGPTSTVNGCSQIVARKGPLAALINMVKDVKKREEKKKDDSSHALRVIADNKTRRIVLY